VRQQRDFRLWVAAGLGAFSLEVHIPEWVAPGALVCYHLDGVFGEGILEGLTLIVANLFAL